MNYQKILLLSAFICRNLTFFAADIGQTSSAQDLIDPLLISPTERLPRDTFLRGDLHQAPSTLDEDTTVDIDRLKILSSSYKKDEINEIKTTLKITSSVTVAALAAAGILHYSQRELRPTRGSSLLSAGDIFGAGGAAQGGGAIAKGIALAIAAGGAIYTIRKFYGLIDLRFEAQEKKHTAERELALRQNNDAWTQRLTDALTQQEQRVQQIVNTPIQQLLTKIQTNEEGTLKTLCHLTTSVESLHHLVRKEKERTDKRLYPIIDWAQHITQILEESKIVSLSTDSYTSPLQQNLAHAAALAQDGHSSTDTIARDIQAAKAAMETMAATQSKVEPSITVGQIPSISIAQPRVEPEKSCCGCSIC